MRALVLVVLLGAAPAWAQERAAAQAAFDEGRKLMKAGRFAEACPRFEASQKLDPATGTLMNLAECWQKIGRLASAWAAYVEVAERAHKEGSAPRESKARARAADLAPKLGKIVIKVEQQVTGLAVTRDGLDALSLVGIAVPVDPGEHAIEASAKGKTWSQKVTVTAETVEVTVPPFWAEPVKKLEPAKMLEPAKKIEPPPPSPPTDLTIAPPPPEQQSNRRKVGWILAGAGAAVAVGGLAVGFLAKSAADGSNSDCFPDGFCDPSGYDARHTAQVEALISTVMVSAGGAAVITGLILVLTAPKHHAPEPSARLWIAPSVGGWAIGGTF
jgi:hypothetical protein